MKKTLLSLLIITALLLSLCACSQNGEPSEKYAYSHSEISSAVPSEYDYLYDNVHFIYEDTELKLFDDGTWCIDTSFILSFRLNVDEGSYVYNEDADRYTFSGFEYDTDVYGYKSSDEFVLVFSISGTTLFTVYYKV